MRRYLSVLMLAFCLGSASRGDVIYESNVVVQTFVGSGFYGLVDGIGVETMFNQPEGVAFGTDASTTNLFILDYGNQVLRVADRIGQVTTVRGQQFTAIATDNVGYVWTIGQALGESRLFQFPPYNGQVVNQITSVTTLSAFSRIAVRSNGEMYLSVPEQNRIFVYDSGQGWRVFAGSGNPGNRDGTGIFCSFLGPRGLAFDSADNLYVADFGNRSIRKIAPDRTVTTFLQFYNDYGDGTWPFVGISPFGELTVDRSGNIYVLQKTCVRKVSPTKRVTTVAGTPDGPGFYDGDGRYAMFRDLSTICLSPSGDIYVADRGDHRIRRIILNPTEQPATSQLQLGMYPGLSITGIIGRTYRIETATSLALSNWTTAATIQLPETPHLWIDRDSSSQRKFYRAFLLP